MRSKDSWKYPASLRNYKMAQSLKEIACQLSYKLNPVSSA
jgi:hypothetical protein